MKKFKNFVFSVWSLVTFVVLGPVLVSSYSLVMALMNGYSVSSPLCTMLIIAIVAYLLYAPMAKAKDIHKFDSNHEFESIHRIVFGGAALAFIALFSELDQTAGFGYTNPIVDWLLYGWFGFIVMFFVLVILVFGLGVGRD